MKPCLESKLLVSIFINILEIYFPCLANRVKWNNFHVSASKGKSISDSKSGSEMGQPWSELSKHVAM